MKVLFTSLLTLFFIFSPLFAMEYLLSDILSSNKNEKVVFKGFYDIKVTTGNLILFKGTKECYLIIDEEKKEISFGSKYKSGYHLKATYVKDGKN